MDKYIAYSATNILAVLNLVGLNRTRIEKPASDIDIKFYRRRIEKGLRNYEVIKKQSRNTITSILEFGTGAHGIDLMLSSMLGIKQIHTVDIDNHINTNWAQHSDVFIEYLPEIKRLSFSDVDPEQVIATLKGVKDKNEFFSAINGHLYFFHDFVNQFNSRIDLWYSESNLQRIPLNSILKVSEKAVGLLSTGGLAFHRLDLSDIYTQPHWPLYIPSAHRFDFLKYHDMSWKIINRDSYSSQNRLRLRQYHELFSSLGLSLISSDEVIHNGDVDYVKEMSVAPMFQYIPSHELCISHARVLYVKENDSRRRIMNKLPGGW